MSLQVLGGSAGSTRDTSSSVEQISATVGLTVTATAVVAGNPISGKFISSSTGSDGNPGTAAQPWQTLSALSGVSNDENVWLLAGDTWTNQLATISHSGSPGSQAIFGTYYLDGGVAKEWVTGQTRAVIDYAQGFNSANRVVDINGDYILMQDIEVTTGQHTFVSSFAAEVINADDTNWVTIDNCKVSGQESFAQAIFWQTAIQLTAVSGARATNFVVKNTEGFNSYNFIRSPEAQNFLYDNNLSYDLFHNHYFLSVGLTPLDLNGVVQNNDIRNSYRSDGIQTNANVGASSGSARNLLIRDNVFYGGDGSDVAAGGNQGTLAENAIDLKSGAEIYIFRNIIQGVENDFDGDHLGGNQRTPKPGAIMHGSGGSEVVSGRVLVRECILYDNSGGVDGLTDFSVVNCTMLANNRDYTGSNSTWTLPNNPPFASVRPSPSGGRFSNNIIGLSNRNNIRADQGYSGVCDSNLYLTDFSDSPTYAFDDGTNPDPVYTSLAAWQAATGLDTNSLEGAADFVFLPDADPQGNYFDQGYDFTPTGAAAIGTAQPHARANGPGITSTTLTVDDGSAFAAKIYTVQGVDYEERDYIVVGSNSVVRLIDVSGNTLTLDTPISWSDTDEVWLSDSLGDKIDNMGVSWLNAQTEYYVSNSGDDSNPGTQSEPWLTLTKASGQVLAPGSSIFLERGDTFTDTLTISSSGTVSDGLTVGAYGTGDDPVLRRIIVSGDYVTLDNLNVDQNKGANRPITVTGIHCTIQNCEIQNATVNGIDADGADNLTVDNCQIHHLLNGNWNSSPIQDAHGVTATGTNGITVNNCIIYQVSGDSVQVDPARTGSDNLTITGCTLYTEPLSEDFNAGWVTGNSPGENALDTKTGSGNTLNLTMTNCVIYGFSQDANTPPAMSNRAALNLKEQVVGTVNRMTIYDSEIAFRLRGDTGNGAADLTVKNSIVYDCDKAMRFEDGIASLEMYNNTFGNGITTFVDNQSLGSNDLRNNAFLGTVPTEFSDPSNLEAQASDFTNVSADNYTLSTGSSLIDQGDAIVSVVVDRAGTTRSATNDVGAYDGGEASTAHSYFDSLVANPATLASFDGRDPTNLQMWERTWSKPENYNAGVLEYDPVEDATEQKFGVNDANGTNWGPGKQGVDPGFGPVGPSTGHGSILYYWECKYDTVWSQKDPDGSVGGTETHKEFILLGGEFGPITDERTVEIRTLYDDVPEGQVGLTDYRDYGGAAGFFGTTPSPNDSFRPWNDAFVILPNKWIYYWSYIDFNNKIMSGWTADEDGQLVKTYDAIPVDFDAANLGLVGFLFRHNTSQSRSGPATSIWNRNLVIMTGLTEAQAQNLVDQR